MTGQFVLPDLIDNSGGERTMTNALNSLLQSGPHLRIATGFFNLGGYTLIRDGLRLAQSVKVLLGKEPTTVQADTREVDLEEITDEVTGDLSQMLAPGRREEVSRIQHFLEFLKREVVQFRLYQRRFFHAKAYILDGVPAFGMVALVGSSNFTSAGLTGNTELNMAQKQGAVAGEFADWFDRFWADEKTLDYKQQLLDLYTRATSLHAPYLIYMKSLWEALHDRFGSDLLPPDGSRPSPILLADFQHDGYASAKQILETYNGVLIADPVGFGKTYLALRLLDDYAYQLRQKALVICPAQLRDVWWRPKLDAYRIYADIVSQERVSQADFPVEDYADADVVVVDECHNFRNPDNNRWQNLSRLLTTGKPKKLILLTATPINTNVFDLYHQLRLLVKDRTDYFAGVGIRNLFQYFREAENSQDGLHDLLETIAVRRSRDFIRRNYPEAKIDGQKVHFPERRLHTVNYDLQQTYEGLYTEVVKMIQELRLAPYLLDFFKAGIPEQLRLYLTEEWDGDFSSVPVTQAMQLGRQAALAGLMRILYLKRLESSVRAFQISIDRARRFQRRFLEQLKAGRLLRAREFHRTEALLRSLDDVDDDNEITRDEAVEAVEAEIETIMASLEPIDSAGYDVDVIEKAVQHDIRTLEYISRKLQPLTQVEDDKLATLKQLLRTDLRGHKVLIFSYFRDTARYLWRALVNDEEFLQALGHRRISFAYSGLSPEERRVRIIRFSPKSNGHREIVGSSEEIDLLVSTDVLSEGQNLQDADVLVNYDLHWNPVRMVQRAGRIDRLGSEFAQIQLYNFFPEAALESLITIVERLRNRLDAINRVGLLDAPVMGEVPTPQDFNALRRIEREDGTVIADLDGFSDLDTGEFLKQELLNFLKTIGEERLKELLPFAGSGKRAPNGRRGLFVHLRAGAQHFQLFYDLANGNWENRRLEALKLARCTESEPIVLPDFDIYPIVAKAKKHIADYMRQARLQLPKLVAPQNHVVNWLRSQNPARSATIRELLEYFNSPLPPAPHRRLKRLWAQHRTDPKTLQETLQILVRDNPVIKTDRPEIAQFSEDDIEVRCYMALV